MSVFVSEQEKFWAIGILEGEGCFIVSWRKEMPNFAIQCNMTDHDVLLRLHRSCGLGTLTGPHAQPNKKHKDYYRWRLGKRVDVQAFLDEIVDHLGDRRRAKVLSILDLMDKYPKKSWQHGTRWGYEGHKCRCDKCRKAFADHHRQRARRKGRPERASATHGTRSMYVRHKCRCKPCRSAALEYERSRYCGQICDESARKA